MAAVCWQWPSKLLSSLISLFWGNKTTKTKPFDRFVAASSVSLINLYLFFNDECEMFSWMYEKENKWWWSCSVKSDLYIQRELSLAVMMLLPEGLHSLTLTTRGRVIKQSHKEHSEEDVSIVFNELNYCFWTTVNWTLIVLLLHLFAFVLFVWNHSFFLWFWYKKRGFMHFERQSNGFLFFLLAGSAGGVGSGKHWFFCIYSELFVLWCLRE